MSRVTPFTTSFEVDESVLNVGAIFKRLDGSLWKIDENGDPQPLSGGGSQPSPPRFSTAKGIPGAAYNTNDVATNDWPSDTVFYAPFIVEEEQTFTALVLLPGGPNSETPGSKIQAAIYECDANGQPGALLADAGEYDLGNAGAESNPLSLTLQPGNYLIAWQHNDPGTPTIDYITATFTQIFTYDPTAEQSLSRFSVAKAYAAWANPGTHWDTATPNGADIGIGYPFLLSRS